MKTINVSQLKAQLSRYLRLAARGSTIIVRDRDEPIAQLGPLQGEPATWRERLAREGRLIVGSQDWRGLKVSSLNKSVDIQAALRAVREDPDEIRRR